MNPVLKYPGAKWRIAQWVISHFPEHEVYLEPYFGSGAVFFNKEPSRIETINDIDSDIYNFFKVIREQPEELARIIEFTPWAREEYIGSYQDNTSSVIERARLFAIRACQSYSASLQHPNGWRRGISGTAPSPPKMWAGIPPAILQCAARLKNAQIENIDAIELIRSYNNKDVLIYLDPPYVHEARKKIDHYSNEMTADEHLKLLKVCKESKSKIIISGYDNELYNNELAGWFKDSVSTSCEAGQSRSEVLWMNFVPACEQLSLFEENKLWI